MPRLFVGRNKSTTKQPYILRPTLIFILVFLLSCRNNKDELTNTKWRVTSISVASTNSLSNLEKSIIPKMNDSMNMHLSFTDTLATFYDEGKVPVICKYILHKDTLFFINTNNTIDTQLILKLTTKSFETASLQGVRQSSIRE